MLSAPLKVTTLNVNGLRSALRKGLEGWVAREAPDVLLLQEVRADPMPGPFAALGYATSRGRRDFTSVTQTVATKYEVLCEHKVAAQAREMLQKQPGARAAAFE